MRRRDLFGLVVTMLAASACGSTAAPDAGFPDTPLTTVTSKSGKLHIAAFTAPEQPPSRGTITTKLVVTDADQKPVEGLVFDMVPEMPSMGHGTPVVPRITAQEKGTYLAEDVDLFMAGRWDLRLHMTGGATDDAIVSIDVR